MSAEPSQGDTLRVIAREVNEIIHAAPLPRMRDEDGAEWVNRDALAAEIRAHMLARIRRGVTES